VKPVPLVQLWALVPFVRFLRDVGAPCERWLEASKIHPDLFSAPHRVVPVQFAAQFIEQAARAEGAETLGIDVGRRSAAEDLGPWGLRLGHCATLYERASLSCSLLSQFNTGERLYLEVKGEWARVRERLDVSRGPGWLHGQDFTLMLILEAVGRAAGKGWKPNEIFLPGPKRARFERDELFQGVRIVHEAPELQVVFPAALLARPMARRPVAPTGQAAMPATSITAPASDLVGSLEETVMALLPAGAASARDLAEIADTSVRSLQRRLRQRGTSLRRVLDRARFRAAEQYLYDPAAEVTDIALQLGYADSSAFARAFRRIAGLSPSAYRQAMLAGPGKERRLVHPECRGRGAIGACP
jgi:AraC-like DNA-binding protein